MRLTRPLALCAFFVVVGCNDMTGVVPGSTAKPAPPARVLTAYVAVSDSAPAVGSLIIVSGNVAGPSSERAVGSFRAVLRYDPAALDFDADVSGAGAMIAMNPQSGHVTIAGASPTGIPSGRLFAVRFRVKDPAGANAIALDVLELNDVVYSNRVVGLRTDVIPKFDRTLK